MKIRVIVNRDGGSAGEARLGQLQALLADRRIDADVRILGGDAAATAFAEASIAKDLDALVAAGGDGTVNAAAAALAGGTLPLGIVPMGSLNHFARDAGIPLDLEGAVAVIAAFYVQPVDVAEVNNRIFINNSAIGLYPEFVREREAQQLRLGRSKRLAMLIASLRAMRHFSRHRLTIRVAGREAPIETPLLFVGNGRYDTRLLTLERRQRIDGGELCIYAVLARTRFHFLGLALRGLIGRLDQQRDFISLNGVEEAEILSGRHSLPVSTDGETQRLETPLCYRIKPRSLRLILPPPNEEAR